MSALTHEFTETLDAPRERVFRAFTEEPELMRWFAEHVEVDAHTGGEYRFWGRHTCGVPSRAQATQAILRLHAPRLLQFSWRFEGRDSEVTVELQERGASAEAPGAARADAGRADATRADAPSADALGAEAPRATGTVLQVRHHFAEAPAVPRAPDLVDDVWRSHMANLRAHLSGDEPLLPDFAEPVPRVRLSILIDAPRDRIYEILLDPAALGAWLGAPAPVVEPHVGGRYSYGWKYEVRGRQVEGGPTRILELVENTKLVTDWPDWRGNPAVPAQRITWLLESIGPRTRVTLVHEPFERTSDMSDYPHGWRHFLQGLKRLAEAS